MSDETDGMARLTAMEIPDAVHSPEVSPPPSPDDMSPLAIDTDLVERWLVEFLRSEIRGLRTGRASLHFAQPLSRM